MRQIFFWTHFVIAFLAATFVIVMAVTGVLLTYEAQITRWARNAQVAVPAVFLAYTGISLGIGRLARMRRSGRRELGKIVAVDGDG